MQRALLACLLATLLLPLANAQLPSARPSAPQDLAAEGGIGRIDLTWSAPADPGLGVSAYRVYRDGLLRATVPANATSFADTGLGASDTHTYVVKAVSLLLEGDASHAATATTSATPPAPTNLVAQGGVRAVSLRWSSPPADAFRVYRDGALVAEVANATYNDTGLADATTYTYAVSAVENGVEGATSAPATARTLDSPDAPRRLTARGEREAVSLAWLPPLSGNGTGNQTGSPPGNGTGNGTGGNGSLVYRVYAHLGGWTLLGETTQTSYRDAPVAAGETRVYRVTAVTSRGESPPSNVANATAYGLPPAPQDLQATASNVSIHLAWSAPASDGGARVTQYNVYAVAPNGTRTRIGATTGNQTSFDDVRAPPGEARTYVVTAVNAAGEGPASNEATAT
ncbi:MAG TPA: fibronectin type III domain-containing protein, partial [Candidatus Thermoplasmatota archaeon]|nr:fibronectin type III domain-containing protein [Candidatus Thermoplasmatota archaeon]